MAGLGWRNKRHQKGAGENHEIWKPGFDANGFGSLLIRLTAKTPLHRPRRQRNFGKTSTFAVGKRRKGPGHRRSDAGGIFHEPRSGGRQHPDRTTFPEDPADARFRRHHHRNHVRPRRTQLASRLGAPQDGLQDRFVLPDRFLEEGWLSNQEGKTNEPAGIASPSIHAPPIFSGGQRTPELWRELRRRLGRAVPGTPRAGGELTSAKETFFGFLSPCSAARTCFPAPNQNVLPVVREESTPKAPARHVFMPMRIIPLAFPQGFQSIGSSGPDSALEQAAGDEQREFAARTPRYGSAAFAGEN